MISGEAPHGDILPQLGYVIVDEILYLDVRIFDISLLQQALFRKEFLQSSLYDLIHHLLGFAGCQGLCPQNLFFLLDELRLDFQFETPEEMAKILKSLTSRSGSYSPYNFEHGLI